MDIYSLCEEKTPHSIGFHGFFILTELLGLFVCFKYNKLPSYCCIPTWIQCNLEGNYEEMGIDACSSSIIEMDVYETPYENNTISVPHNKGYSLMLISFASVLCMHIKLSMILRSF